MRARLDPVKAIRAVLWALFFALVFGLVVGTLVRVRLDRQVRYLGSAPAALPLDVGDAGPVILHARQHEEQVG